MEQADWAGGAGGGVHGFVLVVGLGGLRVGQARDNNELMADKTKERSLVLADTLKERLWSTLVLRAPWLAVGLAGGLLASGVVSKFETTIEQNIALAFFLPVIVYMSDAVGTQTEAIFIRRLALGRVKFWKYLAKEMVVGGVIGMILGSVMAAAVGIWMGEWRVAAAVGLAMTLNVFIAPIAAMTIPELLFKEHVDPAVGSGPFATIVLDLLSVVVYLSVAKIILG